MCVLHVQVLYFDEEYGNNDIRLIELSPELLNTLKEEEAFGMLFAVYYLFLKPPFNFTLYYQYRQTLFSIVISPNTVTSPLHPQIIVINAH